MSFLAGKGENWKKVADLSDDICDWNCSKDGTQNLKYCTGGVGNTATNQNYPHWCLFNENQIDQYLGQSQFDFNRYSSNKITKT